ncbi:MAG: hypothetical protein HRF46_05280, partial [Acidobacteriota bacterium]
MGARVVSTLVLGGLLAAAAATAQEPRALAHRAWLLDGVPSPETLTLARGLGVDGLVLPLGKVVVTDRRCDLELVPTGATAALAGWRVNGLVWV